MGKDRFACSFIFWLESLLGFFCLLKWIAVGEWSWLVTAIVAFIFAYFIRRSYA